MIKLKKLFTLTLLGLGLIIIGCTPNANETTAPTLSSPDTTSQASNSESLFIGISVVDDQTAWISGTAGAYGRTTDGGQTWQVNTVPGADSLQFRDVHAVDAQTAYLLSIGNGSDSRIYKTTDGGANWDQQFTNQEEAGFFDCLDFWDPQNGMAFSDSFEGSFYIIQTTDGGANWTRVSPDVLPPALEGEGSFAASGTCLMVQGENTVRIATGAGGKARVLTSHDRGASWSVVETPVTHGNNASGLASLSFLDENRGVAAGGNMLTPDSTAQTVAVTEDGGATWALAGTNNLLGAVYGISYVPNQSTPTLVAVGPKGIDYSQDNGQTWTNLSKDNYWSVGFSDSGSGWAIGTAGKILKVEF